MGEWAVGVDWSEKLKFFSENSKKKGGAGVRLGGGRGQGICERRSEVF